MTTEHKKVHVDYYGLVSSTFHTVLLWVSTCQKFVQCFACSLKWL